MPLASSRWAFHALSIAILSIPTIGVAAEQTKAALPKKDEPASNDQPSLGSRNRTALAALEASSAAKFGALPRPTDIQTPPDKQTLYLELVINGKRSGVISAVEFDGDRPHLPAADLQAAGVLFHSNQPLLALQDLPGATSRYQASDQSLLIDLPLSYLPSHRFGLSRKRVAVTPSETAFLFNYDAQISGGNSNGSSVTFQGSLFHEARLTGDFGAFSTSGLASTGWNRGYLRYDSVYRMVDTNTATLAEVGDFVTRGFSNASAVRLAGLQISRDFKVRPDIITYPIPDFAGRAALPSTVELLIDGRSLARQQVDPGNFIMEMPYAISGAGQAQLVITDPMGRSIATSQPFYVANTLLAPGLTDFAGSVGFFRKDFGFKNFSYGQLAASGALRHGITNSLTGELRAEASSNFILAGAGLSTKISKYGVFRAATAFSRAYSQTGHQLSLGYDYVGGPFSLGLRHDRQSRHFSDLGYLQYEMPILARQTTSASAGLSLGSYGNIGASYAEDRQESRETLRYLNASYSLPIQDRIRLYAQGGQEFSNNSFYATLALNIRFGPRNDHGTISVSDRKDGPRSYAMDYSRSLPSDNGFGWNIGASADDGGGKNWRGDVLWRTDSVQLRANGFGNRANGNSSNQFTLGASGGIIVMDKQIYLSNRLANSFAIVSTNGAADVPVRYENQLIGRTNRAGKLFIPTISSWYDGLFAIDPLDLPSHYSVPVVEQRAAIAAGRGAKIFFSVQQRQPVLANVRLPGDHPVEAGSFILSAGQLVAHMGWEGLLYIDDISALPREPLDILSPEGKRCTIDLPWAQVTEDDWNVGDLICRGSE